jgi:heptosyltransferase-3
MMEKRTEPALACLIVARNLGDAVIQSGFLLALASRGYAKRYIAWVRPQVAFLFRDIPDCEVVCSQFPVGTAKRFAGTEIIRFVRAAWRIHRLHPDVSIDLIGDMRERMFARLIGAARHLHLGWADGHPFNRLIRNHLGRGRPLLTVPVETSNVYAAHRLMLDALAPARCASVGPVASPGPECGRTHLRVGVHPLASQACKLWPVENWRTLIGALLSSGAAVCVFGAPSERAVLLDIMSGLADRVTMITEDIELFAQHLAQIDVLVGLDSFSVHLGWRLGVRSVMINAGNPPDLWNAPSLSRVLGGAGGCPHYPCYNVPRCVGSSREYACVKSTTPEAVLDAIRSLAGEVFKTTEETSRSVACAPL